MSQNESNHFAAIGQAPSSASHGSGVPATGRWFLIVVVILGLLTALGVLHGIHSRVEAQAGLHQAALESATPVVEVVHPASGADAEEIELPGNTQPFNDTPIYARTSGYVEHWYVDIGTHVKQGQLLALIETPELDQQLEQQEPT